MSLPSASGASHDATAAAEPPELPPGTRAGSSGWRVGPKAELPVSQPMANSSRFVLPSITHPAARSLDTAVASYGGTKCSSARDAQVVRTFFVHRLSFTAKGTPSSGESGSPAASARANRLRAASSCVCRKSAARPTAEP